MKKIFTMITLMLCIGIGVSQAQIVTDSWAFGFGGSFPRYSSVNITILNSNYGGYLSIQRNFSENVGLRLKGGYSHFEGEWTDALFNLNTQSTNLLTADLDLLYYFVPCAPVSPYLVAGGGVNYKNITNGQTVFPDDNKLGTHLSVGVGAEFKLSPSFSLVTEYGYHITNNSELEGTIAPTELNGRDSYIILSAGFNFLFGQGEPSKICEPCEGMTVEMKDMTDYNKIEDMIKKHIPIEVIKEVVVNRSVGSGTEDNMVLVGVNFAFDKSDLLPEAYPVLDNAVSLLKDSPNVNVEIEGHCDYIGSAEYNQKLSLDRAQTVKAYLVSKGIAESRLTTIGYGKSQPIADNHTDSGRAMNRRIVFRVIK